MLNHHPIMGFTAVSPPRMMTTPQAKGMESYTTQPAQRGCHFGNIGGDERAEYVLFQCSRRKRRVLLCEIT